MLIQVVDIIRCRVVCSDGRQLLALENLLKKGFQTSIDGTPLHLKLLRAKNKFPGAADVGSAAPILLMLLLGDTHVHACDVD